MTEKIRSWLERPIHPSLPAITNERLIFAIILLTAIVSRLYNLGLRVMSHDESLHTYFSWLLYKGDGYQHNPMMHGPLQFHLIALSYFLFGPSDFSARLPAAFFGIATIVLTWHWRRYLGKVGGLLAGVLMVISPIMLFYGRYVREDPYAIFSGVLMLYVVLRYFEGGDRKYLYWLAVALLLHFIDKETSFMYTAELLVFLAVYFVVRITRTVWEDRGAYRLFVLLLAVGILMTAAGLGVAISLGRASTLGATEVAAPANPSATTSPLQSPVAPASAAPFVAGAGLLVMLAAAYILVRSYGWDKIKQERSFDMLMLAGTLVLPMLVPFVLKLLETQLHVQIPTTAGELQSITPRDVGIVGGMVAAAFLISFLVGQFWRRDWWKLALTFWVPFTIFYTTVFTNTDGFLTGVVGSLGYWLVQQGVQRGSQPWYYYILILLPVYEFLPLIGALAAGLIAILRRREMVTAEAGPKRLPAAIVESSNMANTVSLLAWWIIASIAAFTVAGEKMPWLTYHLTWPLILFAAWGIGWIVETTDWTGLRDRHTYLVLGVAAILLTGAGAALLALLGPTPPFRGSTLDNLQATSQFLLPLIATIAAAFGLYYLLRDWKPVQITRIFVLTVFSLLGVLTMRAAFRAAYINYDTAKEYLVYAHASRAVKDVIQQAAEISRRTTGGMGVDLAYDASAPDTGVSWPFVWYLRDFTNQHSFDQPTRALRDSTIVIVDAKNFDKIDQALGTGFYRFDYIRMWWPNQDYFNLVSDRAPEPFPADYSCNGVLSFFRLFRGKDFSRVCSAVLDPQIRAGIIDIWLNRNYSEYAAATGNQDLTLATWQPSDGMRMYIKKDVAAKIWEFGVPPAVEQAQADPYAGKTITLAASSIVDSAVVTPPMNAPRQLAFAPDGSFYVADSRNHRILHFSAEGLFINQWGSASGNSLNNPDPNAPPATFNEPWGVAVGPDGSVYVTDTWNYRVQKFRSDGTFLTMWSTFGPDGKQTFYGPRGIAVDNQGRVLVVDTGNKRIVIFDSAGNYLGEFGSAGLEPGQFDEPVGVALDSAGLLYVTDTWNQRVQTFTPGADGVSYSPLSQWDVVGWNGQSLENKPFIAVDDRGHVFITDPEGSRVIEYTAAGQLIQTWGDYGTDPSSFGIASGIAVDAQGSIWVTDSGNNRIAKFTLP